MESLLIDQPVSRRGMLGAIAAGSAIAFAPRRSRARQPDTPRPARTARNLIFMVSDGMSAGTLTLAELYSRKTRNQHSQWVRLLEGERVRRAQQTTHSADGPVTDSAAAASAWGTGFKCNNGSVNITPDGWQKLPLLVHAAQNGKKTGLVTTTRVTHATPAGFSANCPKRDLEDDIARDQIDRRIDCLLGGGAKHFPDALLNKARDPLIIRDAAALTAVDPAQAVNKQLIGLFAKQHIPFVTDRTDKIPTLPAMAKTALSILGRASEGFVLQIEGGRVDHGAHSSDAYAIIREQIEFDETTTAVLEFLEGRDDTLLIITTDHGNANPGITLYGPKGREAFDRLAAPTSPRKSFEWIDEQLPSKASPDDKMKVLPDLVEQATGVKLSTDETKLLAASFRNERVSPFLAANVWTFILGSILADHFGVGFVSPNHTSDVVELLAIGPGSETIPPWVDNTELHTITTAALALVPGKDLPNYDQQVAPVKPGADD
jgi:alkaline phosphatase